ncbi:unnamed protein product [Adineta steineri]|uniref:SMP-30/Gluconolactonase/LRE-like region domain-containing protein n=2 Tax=Adineta steineri TaxID=433720 RepID=A0A819QIC1_9BILA|nr:unnamed protein product [Adineta steineri]
MLFQLLIIICISTNTYASNKLVTLPLSITSLFQATYFYRNTTVPFSFTNCTGVNDADNSDPAENKLLKSRNASFISYSTEFKSLIDSNTTPKLIEQQPVSIPFAHEGGAYVPETNEVWFSANQLPQQNTNVSSINLTTNEVTLLNINNPINTPNGIKYFNSLVYVCSQGTKTIPAAIYAVNPTTLVSKVIVNSWFGYRLNSPNDVTFSTKISGKTFMWFTDPQVAYQQGFAGVPEYQNTVFRYDMLTGELRPVITDLITPNGIAFNQEETVLYVSDTTPTSDIAIVYAYDLTKDGLPMNRRIFSVSSYGIPDGIKVDKYDRVWTAEGDGINVRNSYGTLLGVILGYNLSSNGLISNFELKDNTVIILAQEKLWRLDLAQNVL